MSEPVRIDGQPGYETRIDAISGKDNTPVTIVQWLRFGGAELAAHHRVVAARRLVKAFPRFRAVRDRHSAALIAHQSRPLGMIRKSGVRFSRKIMLNRDGRRG